MIEHDEARIGGGKKLLAEEVFRHIGAAIVRGELEPHERIRDAELAQKLHVSRMPVREALQRLERVGLVTMYPSRYTEVTEVTDQVRDESREFARYQSGFVARLAAVRLDDETTATALRMIDNLIAKARDAHESSMLRRELFNFLSAHAGNSLLESMLTETSLALARNLRGQEMADSTYDALIAAYGELKEALVAKDGDAAERSVHAIYSLI